MVLRHEFWYCVSYELIIFHIAWVVMPTQVLVEVKFLELNHFMDLLKLKKIHFPTSRKFSI